MKIARTKEENRALRHNKLRKRIFGTAARPRLAVFRSNRFISAQLIDDDKGVTLAVASDLKIKKGKRLERAGQVGTALASGALAKKIKEVIFDRGGFIYTGRVRALAQGARKGGLRF